MGVHNFSLRLRAPSSSWCSQESAAFDSATLPIRGKRGREGGNPFPWKKKGKSSMSRGSANTGETKTSPGAGEKTQPSCVMAAMGAGQSRETGQEPGWGLG